MNWKSPDFVSLLRLIWSAPHWVSFNILLIRKDHKYNSVSRSSASGSYSYSLNWVVWKNSHIVVNLNSPLSFCAFKIPHLFWSLSDTRRHDTQPAERQTASAQKEQELSAAQPLHCGETRNSTKCWNKAASSHQVNSRQRGVFSRNPRLPDTDLCRLWSRPTPHYWIMSRGEWEESGEEETLELTELSSCWAENELNKKKQAEEEKSKRELRWRNSAPVCRICLFWVFCNKPRPRRNNDRCKERDAAGNRLINPPPLPPHKVF